LTVSAEALDDSIARANAAVVNSRLGWQETVHIGHADNVRR
jgi:hypothetical protein